MPSAASGQRRTRDERLSRGCWRPAALVTRPITVTSDPGLRFRAVDAFTDLAEELALAGPLLIGVDDLQWADPSSLLTLGALSRRLARLPVALIGCFRPSPRAPSWSGWPARWSSRGHGTSRWGRWPARPWPPWWPRRSPPSPARACWPRWPERRKPDVRHRAARGADGGRDRDRGGRAEVAELTLPPTLRLTILRRLSFLPDQTLQALRAASILGSRFSLTDLATVTARPAIDLSRAGRGDQGPRARRRRRRPAVPP